MNDRPNILLIMADQLMPFLMGTYGHPVVKTPNLDKLASKGMVLAFSNPESFFERWIWSRTSITIAPFEAEFNPLSCYTR